MIRGARRRKALGAVMKMGGTCATRAKGATGGLPTSGATPVALALLLASVAHAQVDSDPLGSWRGLGGAGSRESLSRAPAPSLALPAWTRSTDADGNTIAFIGQATLAASSDTIFAVGRVSPTGGPANQARLFAFDRNTGAVRWWMPVPTPLSDSDSGPALDDADGTVIFPSNHSVTAFDQATGSQRWQAHTSRSVVNASAVVASDLRPATRVLITDFDGAAGAGNLYCINAGPFDSIANPFQPGDIVWSVGISGTSGNSPAYLDRAAGGVGLVYVASAGVFDSVPEDSVPGQVLAFPADAVAPPAPAFAFTNVTHDGFYGGLVVVPPDAPGRNPSVLAATYGFGEDDSLQSGNLVKVDGVTGVLRWSIECNRTNSIPVPLPGGRIALSTGLSGFSTVPSIELFQESGNSVQMVWDSALATWNDLNGNGQIDPGEFFAVGGWTQQPIAYTFGGRTLLAAGLVPAAGAFSSPSNDLFVLDLDRQPSDAAFVVQHINGSGGSPAGTGISLASVGTAGLVCYGPTPARLDVDADRVVRADDLYSWESGSGARDVDGDGVVGSADRARLIEALRYGESAAMMRGRR